MNFSVYYHYKKENIGCQMLFVDNFLTNISNTRNSLILIVKAAFPIAFHIAE